METTDPQDSKVVSNEQTSPGIFEPGKDAADQEDYPETGAKTLSSAETNSSDLETEPLDDEDKTPVNYLIMAKNEIVSRIDRKGKPPGNDQGNETLQEAAGKTDDIENLNTLAIRSFQTSDQYARSLKLP